MKTAHGQFAFLIGAALAVVLPMSGCAVGGKSFSIDSNSRIPFFGLELRERKPKSNAPTYNSISQSAAGNSRITAALGAMTPKAIDLSSKPVDLQKAGDRRIASATVSGVVKNESPSDVASNKFAKSTGPASIPLPRTDDRPGTSDRRPGSSGVDFQ